MSVALPVDYESLNAEQLAEQIFAEFAGVPACFTCSFQTEDMVVLDILRQIQPEIAVICLETGYHFAETYAYRDQMVAAWNLNLINALPEETRAEHEAKRGLLHIVNPTECCNLRKVGPLMKSLEPYGVWFTGLRREQSPTRANLKKVEDHRTPNGHELKKISLLADWTWEQVISYAKAHNIPELPLYAKGYTSIGCEPCTAISSDPNNARAGRWGGKKLECGIHTFSEKQ
ncbi:MAG: phosphoadenylyl-sulfate reductase [Acidobacteriaceae bacterium]|nr:phosphoadenylyl-sulfate reductase [Acidobacteriaceae bacterium]